MRRAISGAVVYVAAFAFLLFVPGHSLHSLRAWTLLALLAALRLGGAVALHRANPGLMAERRKLIHPGQPAADRILLTVWMAGFAALIAVAAADGTGAKRWGAPMPILAAIGLAAFICGWLLVFQVLIVNAYAVTVVRHQADRGQRVVDRGPYRLIRHPMYAGMSAVVIGMCLWLGSWLAVAASVVPLGALLGRIGLEEPLLRRALPEYNEYASRVRYRLIPGVW